MSVTSRIDREKGVVTIAIDGRFDFAQHKDFRNAYKDVAPGSMRFVVDLSRASYLDSSALGMLLLLREHVGGDPDRVRLIGSSEEVRRVLKIANFDRLFRLD
ncbi:STAS domain-containing protein [Thermochromatium tepidum]|uniref:STAS domain-containing protein n=1 Tax=Thermochromatium tepidum ATCC 43061 TaxID=316276 RepID=A0A6I6EGT6_THETI|nr:STAS domain-containing protein [Thermochromatium tepidum]QGU32527.1 STAS domain-containing protein [Thermochromatium tepidum ATCC 43061]